MDARITLNGCITSCFFAILFSAAVTADAQDIQTISHGEQVDIAASCAQGKVTIVDFYADWCGPCRTLTPSLERLVTANSETVALRKVDIINWGSEVANQYRIQSIPHLKLFDEKCELLAEGNPDRVFRVLNNHLGGGILNGGPGRNLSRSAVPILLIGGLVVLTLFLVFRGRPSHQVSAAPTAPRPLTGEGGTSSWFVMVQNSLEGPFAEDDLEGMVQRREISGSARARRRGESTWTTVDELIEDLQ